MKSFKTLCLIGANGKLKLMLSNYFVPRDIALAVKNGYIVKILFEQSIEEIKIAKYLSFVIKATRLESMSNKFKKESIKCH